jgi:hypothetical protein
VCTKGTVEESSRRRHPPNSAVEVRGRVLAEKGVRDGNEDASQTTLHPKRRIVMKSRKSMLLITALLTAFAGTTVAASGQEVGGGMEMHGKSGDDPGTMTMMNKEAMKKCKKQCMALQKTLKEVQGMVEKAEKQDEKQKLETVRSALDKLVEGMLARHETCPMMQMKEKEKGKKSGMGGMHHPMGK